ncbi:MAG: transporter substrate-binding domain-containing protein [Caldilinea sp.]
MQRSLRIFWLLAIMAVLVALLPGTSLASGNPGLVQQPPPDPATDWARVQAAGTLVFGTAADYPPFEFYNSNFELDGFDIALARAIGEKLGVAVEFNDFAFDGLVNAVRLGSVDAAIGAISVTPDRQQVVDFTNLYYIGNSVALATASFTGTVNAPSDLSGLRVGVQRGSTYQTWAQHVLVDAGVIAQDDLTVYSTPSEIIRDLRNNSLDVGLLGQLTAELAVQRNPALQVVGAQFNQQQFAIAAAQGSSLIEPLNQALLELQSDGAFADLVNRYLQVNPDSVTPDEEAAVVENVTPPAEIATPAPCINSMAFVADLNLDDQNMTAPPIMTPGQDFVKSWRVLNNGSCAWAPDFALSYVNGNRIESSMSGSPVPVGRTVQPGETIDLSASLRAPQTYGVFQGFWQMRDNLGQYFGEVVWVGIQTPDPNPPAPPPPPTQEINPNLRADTNYIAPGQCTAIRWDIDDVNAVYFIDGGNQQGVGGHDAHTVCPGGTTTYTLRVVDRNGATHDFTITITVSGAPDYSINFWADATDISGGQCTTLRWDVRNVQAVYLDGEGVAGVSAREVCPGSSKTYTLNAVKYDGGQDARQVTVNVNSPQPPPAQPPVIRRFTVNSNEIPRGQCVNFDWRTDNAQGVNLLRNGGAIVAGGPGNGSAQDCPDAVGLFEYKLVAYGVGQTEQNVTVNVAGPQPR